jgi:DNA primase
MDEVDKIKQKLDIVELIGERLQLKKAGRNFKANCPFHNEKTASFVVSPERQIWHCFGCQKGGDMFTFIQDFENVTFAEALKELANRAGVKLVSSPARSDREKKQELIYSLNHLSAQFYNYLLLSHPAGKRALAYLTEKRKLTIPLIKTFMIGFAPGNDALVRYLIGKKKYAENDLLLAGLAFQKGRYVSDFFRNRIIFPILDHRSNVIAFSGRILDDLTADGPKYVNTRETPVYIKGDTFFGLNLARDAIKSEGKVIIVEGELDVITAHKEGILNIVAVKGTALTENQIKLLKRFTQKFAFCFDTDPAGTEAQRRSIQLIEREGITATVVIPPQGKDPDELLNENPVAFKKALKNDTNVYDFIIDSALSEFDRKSSEGKKEILDKTLPYLSGIENEVVKEHFLKKLAVEIDTSLEAVTKQIAKIAMPAQKSDVVSPKAQLPAEEITEIYLLSLIFQSTKPKENLIVVRGILRPFVFSRGLC